MKSTPPLLKKMRVLYRKIECTYNGWFGPLPHPEKWVFIVGCYNSGTKLLREILAEHPDIGSMPGEGQFFTDELPLPGKIGLPRLWAIKPEFFCLDENSNQKINVERIKRQWGAKYNDPHKPVLVEKSPTNAARTLWLQKHFENAHFIGIIRNGYAVSEGIHRKEGHSLELAAKQWSESNRIMLHDFQKLQKKKVIRYEELTSDPMKVMQEVLSFLELPAEKLNIDGKMWNIHKQISPIVNMNQKSLNVLTQDEKAIIQSVAGDMLDLLGYS